MSETHAGALFRPDTPVTDHGAVRQVSRVGGVRRRVLHETTDGLPPLSVWKNTSTLTDWEVMH